MCLCVHNVYSLCSRSIHSDRWSRRGDYVSDTARESARARKRERERERVNKERYSYRQNRDRDRDESDIDRGRERDERT